MSFIVKVVRRARQAVMPRRTCWPARAQPQSNQPTIVCPLCASRSKDQTHLTAVYDPAGYISCLTCRTQCKIVSDSGCDIVPADLSSLSLQQQLLEAIQLLKTALAGSGTLLSFVTVDDTSLAEDPLSPLVLAIDDLGGSEVVTAHAEEPFRSGRYSREILPKLG